MYYLFNAWNSSNIIEPLNDSVSTVKSYSIDSSTLNGNVKIWEFVKFMSDLK